MIVTKTVYVFGSVGAQTPMTSFPLFEIMRSYFGQVLGIHEYNPINRIKSMYNYLSIF